MVVEMPRVVSVVESYFLNWFMNSEEAKVLHVGAEWMNILCSRIMGLKLVYCCWNIKVLCQYCSVCCCGSLPCLEAVSSQLLCGSLLHVEAVFSCLIPGGLFDSELLYRNSNRTQEGVSGWEAEIITGVLVNMHHENLWAESEIHNSYYEKTALSVFSDSPQHL